MRTGVRAFTCSKHAVKEQLLYDWTTCTGDGIEYVCSRVHVVYFDGFLDSREISVDTFVSCYRGTSSVVCHVANFISFPKVILWKMVSALNTIRKQFFPKTLGINNVLEISRKRKRIHCTFTCFFKGCTAAESTIFAGRSNTRAWKARAFHFSRIVRTRESQNSDTPFTESFQWSYSVLLWLKYTNISMLKETVIQFFGVLYMHHISRNIFSP